jgi:hypothetical protein
MVSTYLGYTSVQRNVRQSLTMISQQAGVSAKPLITGIISAR